VLEVFLKGEIMKFKIFIMLIVLIFVYTGCTFKGSEIMIIGNWKYSATDKVFAGGNTISGTMKLTLTINPDDTGSLTGSFETAATKTTITQDLKIISANPFTKKLSILHIDRTTFPSQEIYYEYNYAVTSDKIQLLQTSPAPAADTTFSRVYSK